MVVCVSIDVFALSVHCIFSCSKKGCHLCQVNQLGKVTLDHRVIKLVGVCKVM